MLDLRYEGFSLLNLTSHFSYPRETGRGSGPPLRDVSGVAHSFETAFGQGYDALELRDVLASLSERGIGQ